MPCTFINYNNNNDNKNRSLFLNGLADWTWTRLHQIVVFIGFL
jgi:hypothetical protein